MARMPRIVVPGQALHIIQRGVNRQAVFYAGEDYRFYLDVLEESLQRYGCALHAYVLMTNHVHLLMTPTDDSGPSNVMQSVGRRYVRHVNGCYRRTGTLWEGRFKSALINSERYLLTCSRYIEMNPVRAQMVEHPKDYVWSSYQTNAEGKENTLISAHELYTRLGGTPKARREEYSALFDSHIDADGIKNIREGTERGNVVGDGRFREEIESMLKRRVAKHAHGGDRKSETFMELSK